MDRAFEDARAVADAILYEGYLLYPYRRSAGKNRVRWQFGVLAPPAWARAHGLDDDSVAGSAESWWQQTECLLVSRDEASLRIRLRFLQVQRRTVERSEGDGFQPVDELDLGGRRYLCFDEAVPREFDFEVPISALADQPYRAEVAAPGGRDLESIVDRASTVGRLVRRRSPVSAVVHLSATRCAARLLRVRLRVENADDSTAPDAPREEALRRSLVSTHTLLATSGARFLSLLEPPDWARQTAEACRNVHTFPVLVDDAGKVMLSSPIILYDHPRVAPESPGDLHDAAEIDEILSLRALTLTDAEKREARATDARAAAILDRVEAMPPEVFAGLHGTIRSPVPQTVLVAGTRVGKGSRLRLRPRPHGTDAHDMFLAGRTARVEQVLLDIDGSEFLAVTVDDDPGTELHQWYGRLRHFRPDEVEPLPEAEPAT